MAATPYQHQQYLNNTLCGLANFLIELGWSLYPWHADPVPCAGRCNALMEEAEEVVEEWFNDKPAELTEQGGWCQQLLLRELLSCRPSS